MDGYSLDLIFPMLQFLAVHAGYTLFWVTLSALISDVRSRLSTCIALGGISAVIHQDLAGSYHAAMFHLVVALTVIVVYVVRKLLTTEVVWTNNPAYVADLGHQEKSILEEIDDLREFDQLSETTLEKIYSENKEFIDSNSFIKCRVFNEVINWRKQKNIKCRAVTVDGQRHFLNVNFRSVDWLK